MPGAALDAGGVAALWRRAGVRTPTAVDRDPAAIRQAAAALAGRTSPLGDPVRGLDPSVREHLAELALERLEPGGAREEPGVADHAALIRAWRFGFLLASLQPPPGDDAAGGEPSRAAPGPAGAGSEAPGAQAGRSAEVPSPRQPPAPGPVPPGPATPEPSPVEQPAPAEAPEPDRPRPSEPVPPQRPGPEPAPPGPDRPEPGPFEPPAPSPAEDDPARWAPPDPATAASRSPHLSGQTPPVPPQSPAAPSRGDGPPPPPPPPDERSGGEDAETGGWAPPDPSQAAGRTGVSAPPAPGKSDDPASWVPPDPRQAAGRPPPGLPPDTLAPQPPKPAVDDRAAGEVLAGACGLQSRGDGLYVGEHAKAALAEGILGPLGHAGEQPQVQSILIGAGMLGYALRRVEEERLPARDGDPRMRVLLESRSRADRPAHEALRDAAAAVARGEAQPLTLASLPGRPDRATLLDQLASSYVREHLADAAPRFDGAGREAARFGYALRWAESSAAPPAGR